MAKKKSTSRKSDSAAKSGDGTLPVSKETAGAVTGAVVGGMVGGPLGAVAGGAIGAVVGDASAKGKKPVKRAVDAVGGEIKSGRAKKALRSMGNRIKTIAKKAQAAMKKKKKSKAAAAPKKKKAKAAKKAARPKKKKKAKKKS